MAVAAGTFFTGFQQLCGTTNDTPQRYVRRSKPGIPRKIVVSMKNWQALSRVNWCEQIKISLGSLSPIDYRTSLGIVT